MRSHRGWGMRSRVMIMSGRVMIMRGRVMIMRSRVMIMRGRVMIMKGDISEQQKIRKGRGHRGWTMRMGAGSGS